MLQRPLFIRLSIVLALFVMLHARVSGAVNPEREIRIGKDAAREVEKDHKVIKDPQIAGRVERIGKTLAEIANTQEVKAGYGCADTAKFSYSFKVLDDSSVNAFSLPGGYIYVNQGLLNYVQSDQELAAVIAHEVAHSAHHHMMSLLREQSRMDGQIAMLLLAGVIGKMKSETLGNLILGSQLVKLAKTSGYGQRAESDADVTGLVYMTKAGYNPVGMLTFLERLAREGNGESGLELGILQDHPIARDRCHCILEQLKEMHIPIRRRAVTNSIKATVVAKLVNGRTVSEVTIDGKVLFEAVPVGDALTSDQRAAFVADGVNSFLDSEPRIRDVSQSTDSRCVIAGGRVIMAVTDDDCRLFGKTATEITSNAVEILRNAIWRDAVDAIY